MLYTETWNKVMTLTCFIYSTMYDVYTDRVEYQFTHKPPLPRASNRVNNVNKASCHQMKAVDWSEFIGFQMNILWHVVTLYEKYLDPTFLQKEMWQSEDRWGNLCFHGLKHFTPIFHFYTPWKRQKNKSFLTF